MSGGRGACCGAAWEGGGEVVNKRGGVPGVALHE